MIIKILLALLIPLVIERGYWKILILVNAGFSLAGILFIVF
jgi:hypothetical protein